MSLVGPDRSGPEREALRSRRRDRLVAGVLLALLVGGRLADVAPIEIIRLWGLDFVSHLRPRPVSPASVAVVDIDDASLLAAGQWPWPRDLLAGLVGLVAEAGGRAVVLDLLLAEPDRMPPARSANAGVTGGSDAILAQSMRGVPTVAGAALSTVDLPEREGGPGIARIAVRGALDLDRIAGGPAVVRPLPVLEQASRGVGVVNLYPDADAVVRTVPGIVAAGATLLPGLAIEAARVTRGSGGLVIEASAVGAPRGVHLADEVVPTDMRGRIRVDVRDASRIQVVPAHRLLAGAADTSAFAGRVVVVGASASGLGAPVRTAGGAGMSHALFQALAIDTVLGGGALARPAFLRPVEVGAALLIGLALLLSGPRLGVSGLGRAAFVLVVTLPATASATVAATGILFDASFPLITGLVLLGQLTLSRLHQEAAMRRRQEALLARQDAYMRQVVDASFDAIVTVDRSGRIVTANAGATHLFGKPVDVLVGTGIDHFLDGSWAEALRIAPDQALREAVDSRRIILATVGRAGGSPLPAELTVAETATEDRAFVIVLRNIAARLLAETVARRAAERLRNGIARITDGFALFGPDHRLIICNDRFVEMLGEAGPAAQDQERFEVIMRRYADASCAPREAVGRGDDWVAERLAAFHYEGEPQMRETLDGRWFRIDERPTAESGLVGVYTDVTALKWHEMELTEAMLRAEAASSAKSEFLANMSHELRTPLNAVIGFADLMKRELFGPLGNDQYRSYVGDIIASGSKLLSMIEAILEFSRSEYASGHAPETPADLNEAVTGVLRDLHPAILEREIVLMVELGETVPAIAVDGAVLYQILQNLVSNAIKFSDRGGPVSVATFLDADGRPALRVADRGAGVPAELIDKVTQPFWQRQGPLARNHGGVGLGLAIVKSHVDALDGELRFDSRVDEGTTVTVLFPARLVRRV